MTAALRATPERGSLRIARAFALQSGPLAIALLLIMTLSAPLAFYVVRVGELRGQARAVGAHLAAELSREVYRQPQLWKYNSEKLLRNVRLAREPADLPRIWVLDEHNVSIAEDSALALAGQRLLWERMGISAGGQERGSVWVGVSLQAARATAWLLMLPFLATGLFLAGLLYAALRQRDDRLLTLTRRAAELQESERLSIARDLHDATGQTLTAIRLNLQVLQQNARDETEVKRWSGSTLALADTAIDEIRRAVSQLGAAIVDDVGLLEAIRAHCRDVAERTSLAIDCRIDCAKERRFGLAIETAVYRIVQESLHNVVRHAAAQRVQVSLRVTQSTLTLTVDDDGRGFEEKSLSTGRGVGNMRERTELLGGSFAMQRLESRHTELRVELPV